MHLYGGHHQTYVIYINIRETGIININFFIMKKSSCLFLFPPPISIICFFIYINLIIISMKNHEVIAGKCPSASKTSSSAKFVDCYDVSNDGKITIVNQRKSTQRNFKFAFLNMTSIRFTLMIKGSNIYKYANTVALFSFEKVPKEWDITTAGIQLGKFGTYNSNVNANCSFQMKVSKSGQNIGSISFDMYANSYSNFTTIPNNPNTSTGKLQMIKAYDAKRITTEYYEYTNTTTSGTITTSTKVSGNRKFINTTLYISVYCISDCNYDLVLKGGNAYLADTCPQGFALSKSNNALCCPYNGCNKHGNCIINDKTNLPSCNCDVGYTGIGCDIALQDQLPTYGIYIGGLLVIAFLVVFGSFMVMNLFMKSLAPRGKKFK